DKERCEVWKEEVENILLFAALFSAVVTAFVIDSYKALRPDPNDTIIYLLSQIATRLDNPLNASTIIPPNPNISNSSVYLRVNVFWFTSLVLSLSVAIIGVVVLQWLREHQQYPESMTPRDQFALCRMRSKGLEAWHVPQIFPILLL
ncbi:hypothetical protein BDZ97DRAFT_1592955, partial [Flammula alnicola]